MNSSWTEWGANEKWRLTYALMLALAVHAVLIVGVRFTLSSAPPPEPVHSLNVALLEQAGGEPADRPPVESEAVPEPAAAATVPPESPYDEAAVPFPPVATPEEPIEPAPEPKASKPEAAASDREPAAKRPVPSAPTPSEAAPAKPRAVDLMSRGLQMARLDVEARPSASNAREKYIDPQAMTTLERFYMDAWVRKVEQVGTFNFPEEARRRNLTGKLVLDVAIKADGSVKSIRLVHSSGHQVLDEAARQIVEMAAPYAAFPETLRRQHDVLHIVRSWQFLQGNRLQGN